ncbi:MAG: STAS domain-containing protein [Candidatus Solibacter usitatus]|nr:STAS domain-containing protein [Candidatus Solibacter usitatus]
MDLELHRREQDGIAILDLKGRLVVGEAAGKLRETTSQLIASGHNSIILNLAGVQYIDSTGLGTMVICFTSAKKSGGMMKLLKMNRRNLELLVVTKLATVFEVFEDEQTAVNSFFPNREIKKFDILTFLQSQERAED